MKKMLIVELFFCMILVMPIFPLCSDAPFSDIPDYVTLDFMFYSTGASLSDIDKNGYLDLVFSNGNDMQSQMETIYYNYSGVPSMNYGWISSDDNYSGHLAVGDLDKDGDLDLAVANFINMGTYGEFLKTTSKIYYNEGGTFERNPSWQSSFSNNSFAVELGDVDCDGDLDVAFANGQVYNGELQKNTIYRNNDGIIEDTPFWFSEEAFHSMDLVFGDFNNDGLLDLAYANSGAPITIHYNTDSGLSEKISWQSDDMDSPNSIITADFNSDGYQDIALTTNTSYLSSSKPYTKNMGSGSTKIYFNTGIELETNASWISLDRGMTSSLASGDIDGDGDIDLAAGGWWEGSRIYLNEGDGLHLTADWHSGLEYYSVAEAMQFGDVDNDGLTAIYDEEKSVDGTRKIFYTKHAPFREIIDVFVNGKRLEGSEYFANPVSGYIDLLESTDVETGNVSISYYYSKDLDLLVSNWDPDRGNYIFFNTSDDNAPPYVKDHHPPRYSEGVKTDETVSFMICDSNKGVDEDSIEILSNLGNSFSKELTEEGVFVKYDDRLPVGFRVEIEVLASDFAEIPNKMPKHIFTFKTVKSMNNPPVILWAGFGSSKIYEEYGGLLTIWAKVQDPDNDVVEVQLYYSDLYTGLSLNDDGNHGDNIASDGIFSRSLSLPPGIPKGEYSFELKAIDSEGHSSIYWPFIKVNQ